MKTAEIRGPWAAVLFGVCAAGVNAADDPPQGLDSVLTPPPDRWTVRFEPSAWYAAPGGELKLPGSAAKVDFIDLNLDQPRVSPYGELHVRSGDYRLSLSAFSVSVDDVATVAAAPMQLGPVIVNPGDLLVSSVSVTSADVVAAWQLGSPRRMDGKIDEDFAMAFEGLAGVRMYHIEFDVNAPSGSASADEFFITPLAGLKSTLNVRKRFDIDLQVAMGLFPSGGDRSVFFMEITNGYTYRPVENVGVQIGYRLSFYNLGAGDGLTEFEYTGAVAGIFAGVVVRF